MLKVIAFEERIRSGFPSFLQFAKISCHEQTIPLAKENNPPIMDKYEAM